MAIKRTKKYTYALGILLCLFLGGGYYAVENIFPYMGIKPWRMVPAENAWKFPNGYKPSDFGVEAETLKVKTADGLNLSALVINSRLDTTYGVMVMLHGISNCKETNLPAARMLSDSGYACLLLDLRAHGESDGEYCTFGYTEKHDLKTVADTVSARFPGKPIGIWGASLGGAISLQAMENDSRFEFGIIESTFDEFPHVAAEYGADYMLGIRSTWMVNRVLKKSGEIAHFDPFSVKPVESAAKINRPVLFMHGDKDARIPPEFNKRNFEALKHPLKKWISVQNGGHSNLWKRDGAMLRTEVFKFLQACRTAQLH
ncbi:MAG: alpha/beta fold hydrolase [Saprospiraceae bacterium]|nr:alpha/beta fold hydrolase [Saprospiraceae bacterium]